MTQSLKDKVVLITGASSGFGLDAARLFAREGAHVVVAARRLDRLQDLAAEIQDAGGEALAVPVDVASLPEIKNMVQTVIELHGRIDILFNNAGFGRLDFLENLDPERDIETQINVNLLGVIQVTRAVLPHMLAQRSGHIINMSSVAGWLAAPIYSVYAASKFGVRGFTEALRREVWAHGIHVSGIYPGPAATEFSQHVGESKVRSAARLLPGWVSMKSEDVARSVVQVAKRPRRDVILPWWFGILLWFNATFPALSDWVQVQFTQKYH
jgi:uncharacterized protein